MTTRAKQGGFQDWQELRTHLIERYGSTPHPVTEQDIIDAYELHPAAIEKAALQLIDAIGINSHWGVLKTRATTIATAPSNPTRSSSAEREKRILRAEQWIRNAGTHYDRQQEILLALFDTGGLLHDYAQVDVTQDTTGTGKWKLSDPKGDLPLVARMSELWQEARPAGERVEAEAVARAEKWKQHQAAIAALKAHANDDLPL